MRISEVVELLQAVGERHGDLEVRAFTYGDIDTFPVTEVTTDADASGPVYVLIRP